jgi:glycosyltransferase involved in cell wall biosynthesis
VKILYHHRTQMDDAQGIHITEMIHAFEGLGHEVEMLSLVQKDRKQDQPEERVGGSWGWIARCAPAALYELMSLAYNLVGYMCLVRRIKASRPELIYERYSLNTFCGIWASRRMGIPLVLEVNAPLAYEQDRVGKLVFKRLARFSERWICSNSTRTIVVSEAMKQFLLKEGVPAEKIVVMPNGINPQEFNPDISGEAVRRKHQLSESLVVGFVGWFRPWHGLDMLLQVMHETGLHQHGVRLLLVGDGPASRGLQQYVLERGLDGAVTFAGAVRRPDVPSYIAAMDVTVQPSATEYACPMKIFEYMAMGKCIVAVDQPNIREILEEGKTGYLFRRGDREHFKSVLLRVVQDSAARLAVGRQAADTIYRRQFLWSANARRTIELVQNPAQERTGIAPSPAF